MAIKVSGKNIDLGDSLQTFVVEEVQKMADQYIGAFIDAQVVLSKENGVFGCDLDIHISRGFDLRSSGRDADAYTAVSQAIAILRQRVRRYKARLRTMSRQRPDEAAISRFVLADSQEEETIQDTPLIIAEMPDTLSAMTVGDAVMHLDLTGLPVWVFKNSASGQINVVYRRTDRNIGWVAPKA